MITTSKDLFVELQSIQRHSQSPSPCSDLQIDPGCRPSYVKLLLLGSISDIRAS